MTRKILAMLLAMAMLLSMVIVPASANEQPESLTEQAQEVAAEEGAALPEEQPVALPKEEPLEESVQMPLLDVNALADKTVTLTMTPRAQQVTLENGVAYVVYDLFLQTSDAATPIEACAFNLTPRKAVGGGLQETSAMQLASQFPGDSPEFYYSCEADALSATGQTDSYGHPYNLIAYTPSSGYFALSGYDLNGGGIANSQTKVMTIVAKFTESGTYQLTAANCIAGNGKLEDGDIQQFGTFDVVSAPVTVKKAAGAVNVTAAADKTSVDVGETFTVTLSNKAMSVSSFTAGLSFDTNVLQVTQIVTKDGYTALSNNASRVLPAISTVDEANETGKVGFGIVVGSDSTYVAADIVTVTFKAVAAGSTAVTPYETSTSQSASVYGDGTAVNVTAAYAIDENTLVLKVVPRQETICPNAQDKTVTFDVKISNNPGISGFKIFVAPYDEELGEGEYYPDQLELTGLTFNTSALKGQLTTFEDLQADDAMTWAGSNVVSGDETLFTLTAKIADGLSENTSVNLNLFVFEIYDGEGRDMDPENDVLVVPATVTVGHKFSSAWTYDGTSHWHVCENCPTVANEEEHTWSYVDQGNGTHKVICSVCNYEEETVAHSTSDGWKSDGDKHWKECDFCRAIYEEANHHATGDNVATCVAPAICDDCGEPFGTVDPNNHDYEYSLATPATPMTDGSVIKVCKDCTHEDVDTLFYDADGFHLSIAQNVKVHSGAFTVDVSMENNPGVSAMKVFFDYDAEKMTLTSVTLNTEEFTGFLEADVDTGAVTWLGTEDSTFNGKFLTLEFTVVDSTAAVEVPVTLQYVYSDALNDADEIVPFDLIPGKVSITKPGDIDGDGAIKLADVKLLLKYYNTLDRYGKPTAKSAELAAANGIVDGSLCVTGNTSLKLTDVKTLLKYYNTLDRYGRPTAASAQITLY